MPAPVEAYAFALLTAVAWGLSPVVMKRGLERDAGTMIATGTAIASSFGLFFVIATLVYGPGATYLSLDRTALGIFLASGVVGSGLGRLVMYIGIDRVGASVNTAVINTRPLFAAILAIALLGEPFSGMLGLGILTIIIGIGILSISRGGDIRGWHWWELAFPVAAAIAFAVGNVLRRFGFVATESGVLGAMVVNEFAAAGTLGGYVLATRGRKILAVSRRTYGIFILGGMLDGTGVLLLFAALSLGPVVIVDPLTATSQLFAAVFSIVLLRQVERVTPGVIVGAILVLLGVVLVTIG